MGAEIIFGKTINTMKTQNEQILAFLKKGKKITPLDALDRFQCFRIASRVNELREQGYNIKTEMIKRNGKRYAQYSL
jgi:hypothetical protein